MALATTPSNVTVIVMKMGSRYGKALIVKFLLAKTAKMENVTNRMFASVGMAGPVQIAQFANR